MNVTFSHNINTINSKRYTIISFLTFWVFCVLLTVSTNVSADARTDYLVNMLKTGSSYRVKVQAAQSLGRIKDSAAVPALINALKEKSNPVIIAAAAALQEIGDVSALYTLKKIRKKNRNRTVKSQLTATIKKLNNVNKHPKNTAIYTAGQNNTTTSITKISYIVKVDDMGNASSSKRSGITKLMKQIVTQKFAARPEINIQPHSMNAKKLKQKLKKTGKKSFIVSGSLIKLKKEHNFVIANISLNVFSNPGYNLIMMPAGEIKIPVSPSKMDIRESEKQAISQLVDNLIGKILEATPNVL